MNAQNYQYYSDPSFFDFEFESEGPNGLIRKIARFSSIGKNIYNFGFGDLDPETGDISDDVVSNNGDAEKVLFTVARIIYDFTAVYPEALIFIQGSTPARTRWYQIYMNRYWPELEPIFEIFGYRDGHWEHFRKGVNYEAFLGRRKTSFL
jgi:hypothetical protein